jgi:hypothetical protein
MEVVLRVLALWFVVLAVLPAVALGRPEAGAWAGPPASAPGARALVRFTVDGATGLVQPVVRYRLRRCGGRAWSENVSLGLVAVSGRRFEVAARHRSRGIRVRLRLVGRFDSSFEAHGALRGRVVGRCHIPRLSWTAEPGGPTTADDLDEIADEDLEDGEELEEDDFDEDGEPIEDEEPPADEGDDGDPGDER